MPRYAFAFICVMLCACAGHSNKPATTAVLSTAPPAATNTPSLSPTPSASVPPAAASNTPRGFLTIAADWVDFIQWTEVDGSLTGQIEMVGRSIDDPFTPISQSVPLSGVHNDPNVSLTLSEPFGSSSTLTGTLRGDTLTLVAPDESGYLQTTVFRRATVEDYNRAVAAFRAQLARQATEARQASATAAALAAQASATAVREAIESLCRDRTITVSGHDASVAFSGTNAVSVCTQYLEGRPPDAPYGPHTNAGSQLSAICGVTTPDVTITVLDSGFAMIATGDLCPYLQRWFDVSQQAIRANDTLSAAYAALQSDTGSLAKTLVPQNILNSYANDWKQMQADYQREVNDAAKRPFDCYQKSVVSYDASTVKYDLNSIHYDDSSFAFDTKPMNDAIVLVQKDVQALQSAQAALEALLGRGTDARPYPFVTDTQVNAAVAAANQRIGAAQQALQPIQAQVVMYDKQAADLNATGDAFAKSLSCSGAVP